MQLLLIIHYEIVFFSSARDVWTVSNVGMTPYTNIIAHTRTYTCIIYVLVFGESIV